MSVVIRDRSFVSSAKSSITLLNTPSPIFHLNRGITKKRIFAVFHGSCAVPTIQMRNKAMVFGSVIDVNLIYNFAEDTILLSLMS